MLIYHTLICGPYNSNVDRGGNINGYFKELLMAKKRKLDDDGKTEVNR
jgi:hypothetical protein